MAGMSGIGSKQARRAPIVTRPAVRLAARSPLPIRIDRYRAIVFPNRMRELRHARGYAKLLPFAAVVPDIPYIRLSKIERGEVVARPEELIRVSSALGVSAIDLLPDLNDPAFDVARWAAAFQHVPHEDNEDERFAVMLAAAVRARRKSDAALTIATIGERFGLPAVNLSRIENAQKTFDRWNGATQRSIFAIFGVADEIELRVAVAEQYESGLLDPHIAALTSPETARERLRERVEIMRRALSGSRSAGATADAPPSPARNQLVVVGSPLPGGLIAPTPTALRVDVPVGLGRRVFAVQIARPTLGPGLPAHAVVVADPDRQPCANELALIREGGDYRLVAVHADRMGDMLCYSLHPQYEAKLDEIDPSRIATIVAVLFTR